MLVRGRVLFQNGVLPQVQPFGFFARSGLVLGRPLLGGLLGVVVTGCAPFGKSAGGARLEAMKLSPQYEDGKFVNPQPMYTNKLDGIWRIMTSGEAERTPEAPIPVASISPWRYSHKPSSGLRITWLGHSTILIEIDGLTILTDPVWGERTSPYSWVGPKRWYPPPIALEDLPPLDAVIISHDHYDHLDYSTIVAMKDWNVPFFVPLGVGAHLEYWGIPQERITELDWWDQMRLEELTVVMVPARHASGRDLFDQNDTLWGGYVLAGNKHRVYFSGDTGFFPGFCEIGDKWGPFDVTMIEVGAYDSAWPDWHIGPEQAVIAHQMVRGNIFLPIHWGLFNLANHNWTEPMERVLAYSYDHGVTVASPQPGQSVEMDTVGLTGRWWPKVPWLRESDSPIIATENGDKSKRVDHVTLATSCAR